MQTKIDSLESQLEEYKRKVDDLYAPTGLPDTVLDSLTRSGFVRTTTFLPYNNTSGREFLNIFAKSGDRDFVLPADLTGYYLPFSYSTTNTLAGNISADYNDTPVYAYSTNDLPTGLSSAVLYYIKSANGSTFKLSTSVGGADVSITGVENGYCFLLIQ